MFGIEGHLDRLEAPPEPAIWDTPPANNTDIDLRRDETPSRRLRKPRFASVTTTRVFRPVVAEGFEWVQPVNESDFDVVYQLSGESMVSQWIPIEVRELKELSETDTPLLPADMPWLGGHTLLCRERAYAILSPLLEDAGEFLELDLIDSGEPLWLFNACTIIDGLDEDESDVVRFPSSGRVMKVNRHIFRLDRIFDAPAFRVPQLRSLFLGGEVVDAVEAAELSGAAFELVWER